MCFRRALSHYQLMLLLLAIYAALTTMAQSQAPTKCAQFKRDPIGFQNRIAEVNDDESQMPEVKRNPSETSEIPTTNTVVASNPTLIEKGEQNSLETSVNDVTGGNVDVVITDQPKATTEPTKCKEIGKKCYVNSECCSQRCHGFLHQCVT